MLRAEGLKGAIIYYDGQMNDTRMGLTVALTASQHGAVVANRVKVGKGEGDGGVRDVCVCVGGGGLVVGMVTGGGSDVCVGDAWW